MTIDIALTKPGNNITVFMGRLSIITTHNLIQVWDVCAAYRSVTNMLIPLIFPQNSIKIYTQLFELFCKQKTFIQLHMDVPPCQRFITVYYLIMFMYFRKKKTKCQVNHYCYI